MARFRVKLKRKIFYPSGSRVEVVVEIKNKTRAPYYLLKRSLDDYILLDAGKKLKISVSLAKNYTLDKTDHQERKRDCTCLYIKASVL